MPFKKSERQFLSIILKISDEIGKLNLTQNDIDIHFDRKNYENIEVKTNVLNALLNNPKVAPRLAFVMSDMFPDAEAAYHESLPYIEMALSANADANNEAEKPLESNALLWICETIGMFPHAMAAMNPALIS